ncbi:DUF6019 family protein [Enterococcus mediterraneensis]|uniref:DUF6019 family protein n=1 Tax=Enterococcus mediterraneensis TaxID=2364791 RepID=UPI0013DFBE69|nr:DUF6019 family protein [Enterococcus mediterraneensis]
MGDFMIFSMLAIYLVLPFLFFVVLYFVVKAAVKNGIKESNTVFITKKQPTDPVD